MSSKLHRNGMSLVEIMFALGIVGALLWFGGGVMLRFLNRPAAAFADGSTIKFPKELVIKQPNWAPKITPFLEQLSNSKLRNNADLQSTLAQQILKLFGINVAQATIVLGDYTSYGQVDQMKKKSIVGERLVIALSRSIPPITNGRGAVSNFNHFYSVIKTDGSNFTFSSASPTEFVKVGAWINPSNKAPVTVFRVFDPTKHDRNSVDGFGPPVRWYFDQEEAAIRLSIDQCKVPFSNGATNIATSRQTCVVGTVSPKSGGEFRVSYGYFQDWFAQTQMRVVVGGSQIVDLN